MAPIDYSIKDIEKVVKLEGRIKNVEVSRLTAPGENFLSLILRTDFEGEKNGYSKTISTVAKRLPLSNKNDGFDMHGQIMKNEIKWYSEILPMFKDLAEENNIILDLYPKYYGSRFSLDTSKKESDRDSVLVLENLIPQGYQNGDRYIGYDLITSKAILRSLALFHALPIAMKLKEPELFQVIKDTLDSGRPRPPGKDGRHSPDELRKLPGPPPGAKNPGKLLFEVLVTIPDFAPYISKIKPRIDKPEMGPGRPGSMHELTKEPWNTISHNDFWVNNVMVKHSKGNEILVKIVDFQMCNYGSYAKDLVFFLLTSVKNDVTKEYMDDLLTFYYEEFTSILRKANVNIELSFEEYLEEVRHAADQSEFNHALLFSTIVFGEKGTGIDAAVVEFDPFTHMSDRLKKMNQYQKDKLVVMASEAIKRNWI